MDLINRIMKKLWKDKKKAIGVFVRMDEIKKLSKIYKERPEFTYRFFKGLRRSIKNIRRKKQNKRA